MHHNSTYIQRISAISGQPIYVSAADCVVVKNSGISKVGGDRAKTAVFRYAAHRLREKRYRNPMALIENVHSEAVPFGFSTKNSKWGTPNP